MFIAAQELIDSAVEYKVILHCQVTHARQRFRSGYLCFTGQNETVCRFGVVVSHRNAVSVGRRGIYLNDEITIYRQKCLTPVSLIELFTGSHCFLYNERVDANGKADGFGSVCFHCNVHLAINCPYNLRLGTFWQFTFIY